MEKMRDDEGIMLIGHGSRSNESERVFSLQAERLRNFGFRNVRVAFNEMSDETIEKVLWEMADRGIRRIYALPLFIIAGIHITQDISGKLGLKEDCDRGNIQVNGREIEIRYASAIGDDPLVSAILIERALGLMSWAE
ncbi:MAG: sirohydrochlorin cobaltochelatase [Methanomassiliicoccaceae archaeon]|jgi:sirohydrochlorin ferrochelatase|nr:sirohydrochlorin cobaltochelatase [Methanomassiliicoccaceae archaeon]